MTHKNRGLGFNPLLGLDQSTINAVLKNRSLQAAAPVGQVAQYGLVSLPIEQLVPNRFQPRVRFADVELKELESSIRQHGIMQPVIVRKIAEGYELIAGERRWRASQNAGLSELPALIRDLDDQQVAALALIENIQREALTAIEQARALARMRDEFGLDQNSLADLISTSRSNVANLLRLLNLTPGIQKMMDDGVLDMGHARALIPLPESMQLPLAIEIVKNRWSVRQTETQVKRVMEGKVANQTKGTDPNVSRLESRLSVHLGATVRIKTKTAGTGQIIINYSSLDVLDGLVARLKVNE